MKIRIAKSYRESVCQWGGGNMCYVITWELILTLVVESCNAAPPNSTDWILAEDDFLILLSCCKLSSLLSSCRTAERRWGPPFLNDDDVWATSLDESVVVVGDGENASLEGTSEEFCSSTTMRAAVLNLMLLLICFVGHYYYYACNMFVFGLSLPYWFWIHLNDDVHTINYCR